MKKSNLQPTDTIQDAKNFLRQNWKEGAICPCCAQVTKLYARSITSSMAHALILVYLSGARGYFHAESFFKNSRCDKAIRGDFPKLKYFGLIEPMEGKSDDGNPNTGYYKITEKGIKFTEMTDVAPKHVYIYNNKMYGFSEEMVNIQSCLKNKFNYNELMFGVRV